MYSSFLCYTCTYAMKLEPFLSLVFSSNVIFPRWRTAATTLNKSAFSVAVSPIQSMEWVRWENSSLSWRLGSWREAELRYWEWEGGGSEEGRKGGREKERGEREEGREWRRGNNLHYILNVQSLTVKVTPSWSPRACFISGGAPASIR